ncbi:MAG: zinc-finger protein, partial [Devosia sp.]|uniref:zinc-finger domain-containing protein n=1 Tax=Devosia sp. TaxID=1871048 RepID=UPI0026255BBA
PPFDHPHIYIDMGKDNEVVCSYCSTLYIFNPELAPGISEPLSAVYQSEAA